MTETGPSILRFVDNVTPLLPLALDRFGYQFTSCRFNIPQKLSNNTLSLPCNQRTITFVESSLSSFNWILNPSAASSSSSQPPFMLMSVSVENLGLFFCCFRLAARDQTLPFAKPMPVDMVGLYCHCRSRDLNTALHFSPKSWKVVSELAKLYSDGKGSRCLGSVEVPLATG